MLNPHQFFKAQTHSFLPIQYLNDEALKEFITNNEFLVVDVREAEEYQEEHIFDAKNAPISTFSFEQFSVMARDCKVLLHCKSGRRTKLPDNVEKFLEALSGKSIFCMEGGIEQWKRCGFPVISENVVAPQSF